MKLVMSRVCMRRFTSTLRGRDGLVARRLILWLHSVPSKLIDIIQSDEFSTDFSVDRGNLVLLLRSIFLFYGKAMIGA